MAFLHLLLEKLGFGPACLVSVDRTEGSAPRERGAWMAVFADQLVGTIGGGHVEFQAIAEARRRLAGAQRHPRRADPALARGLHRGGALIRRQAPRGQVLPAGIVRVGGGARLVLVCRGYRGRRYIRLSKAELGDPFPDGFEAVLKRP